MHILDLPLERQKEIAQEMNYSGTGSFEGWVAKMEIRRKESAIRAEEFFKEYEQGYTREEAEELIADIIANPEDKVGFAKRMAVNPEWVTAEKMIENIRSRIRD